MRRLYYGTLTGILALTSCITKDPGVSYINLSQQKKESVHPYLVVLQKEGFSSAFRREAAFHFISMTPIMALHDCDDMTLEFRDYLVATGIPFSAIRLAWGEYTTLEGEERLHVWLEADQQKNGKISWQAYDPGRRIYEVPPEEIRKDYTNIRLFPGNAIFDDETGYKNYGDHFENGRWIKR
ncbi:MAG: hypothetical protein Q7R56_02670 [Nanoarchaeota archaeon]|nr:hypothetical protein [Nanoarchaeota archaeon]